MFAEPPYTEPPVLRDTNQLSRQVVCERHQGAESSAATRERTPLGAPAVHGLESGNSWTHASSGSKAPLRIGHGSPACSAQMLPALRAKGRAMIGVQVA
jgi:hypothetical protein